MTADRAALKTMWAVLYGWTPEIFGTEGNVVALYADPMADSRRLLLQFAVQLAVLHPRYRECAYLCLMRGFPTLTQDMIEEE